MATRNSVARLIPGNPLGSILRETAREARRTSRRNTGATGETGPEGPAGPPGESRTQYWARITTDAGGFATWTYPVPFGAVPFLFVTPIGDAPYFCTVYQPTTTGTQVIVWDKTGNFGAPGVTVNITAVSPM